MFVNSPLSNSFDLRLRSNLTKQLNSDLWQLIWSKILILEMTNTCLDLQVNRIETYAVFSSLHNFVFQAALLSNPARSNKETFTTVS